MTKKAIEKLDEKSRERIELWRYHNIEAIRRGDEHDRARYSGKIRGYLECLQDMGKITELEKKALYLYYAAHAPLNE